MQAGLQFLAVGQVQRKYDFEDRQDRTQVYGVEVAYFGGAVSFPRLTREQYEAFPSEGGFVEVEGTFVTDKNGKARFTVGGIKAVESPGPAGGGPKSATPAKASA